MNPTDVRFWEGKPPNDTSSGRKLGLLTLAAIALLFIAFVLIWNPYVTEFNAKTVDKLLIGKTRVHIIEQLGNPIEDMTESGGGEHYTYKGPNGRFCRIYFVNGIAIKTDRWTK